MASLRKPRPAPNRGPGWRKTAAPVAESCHAALARYSTCLAGYMHWAIYMQRNATTMWVAAVMQRRWTMGAAVLLAGIGAAVWLTTLHRRAHADVRSPPPAVPVTAGTAVRRTMPIYAEGLGTVQAINTVNVKSRVDGQILKAFFTQGQEVKQGAPLFLIDPRPYQAALDQALANEQKDAAQLAGAVRDLARYGALVGRGFQTRQSFEDQQATVDGLKGSVAADRAAVEAARVNLGYTLIRAPITGRTGALLVDPGNIVQASAGTTLVSITQLRPIYVDFTLQGRLLARIRRAQARDKQPLAVEALGSGLQRRLASGGLSFIDNHVDVASGTIALDGTFANDNERLWPGEFVNARLMLGERPNAVTVPAQTVMTGPHGTYVYVIRPGDTVARQDVKVAARQDGLALIKSGLAAGTRVVVEGQYGLANGVRVRAAVAASPAASPGASPGTAAAAAAVASPGVSPGTPPGTPPGAAAGRTG